MPQKLLGQYYTTGLPNYVIISSTLSHSTVKSSSKFDLREDRNFKIEYTFFFLTTNWMSLIVVFGDASLGAHALSITGIQAHTGVKN